MYTEEYVTLCIVRGSFWGLSLYVFSWKNVYTVYISVQFSSVAQSCPTLRPHESQHARPPCPLPTPGVHSDSRPSSQWCHPAVSSSVVPFFSCPQPLPVYIYHCFYSVSTLIFRENRPSNVSSRPKDLMCDAVKWMRQIHWWLAVWPTLLMDKGLKEVFSLGSAICYNRGSREHWIFRVALPRFQPRPWNLVAVISALQVSSSGKWR